MAERRFRALRALSALLRVLGALVLLAGVVAGGLIIGIATVGAGPFAGAITEITGEIAPAGLTAAVGGLVILITSVLYFVALFGAGEAIHVLLSVEENTREAANLLRAANLMRRLGETPEPSPMTAGASPLDPRI